MSRIECPRLYIKNKKEEVLQEQINSDQIAQAAGLIMAPAYWTRNSHSHGINSLWFRNL